MKQTANHPSLGQKARFAVSFVVVSALVVGTSFVPMVRADSFSDQITQLQAENNANTQAVTDLAAQATSYQDAISRLQSSIAVLQAQITDSSNKLEGLKAQIIAGQQELDRQKTQLGDNLKTMYVNGQMTTVEMLASSDDLSTFVDAETYRGAVQNKIQASLKQITDLQNKLRDQQQQTELLIAQQQGQQQQLAANQSQQAQLLALNQDQQAAYNQKTKDNQSKIDDLIAAQRRANLGSGNGALYAGSTSYPFANAGFSMSTAPGCNDNDGPDPWGYCTRQCVSYTAWAVLHSGRKAPCTTATLKIGSATPAPTACPSTASARLSLATLPSAPLVPGATPCMSKKSVALKSTSLSTTPASMASFPTSGVKVLATTSCASPRIAN